MADQDTSHPLHLETRAVHAGTQPDPATGARIPPIYQTTSFVFNDSNDAADLFALKKVGFIYSRLTNPTVAALEARVADLEGGVAATCTSSGHAAQMLALFALMQPGDNVVAADKLYGGTYNQFTNSFPRGFGWHSKFVPANDIDAYKRAVDESTKAIFIESLANPGGVVVDIEAVSRVAEDAHVPLIVDNTMATPYLCRPFEWGADLVCHSTTKFLAGQGNSIGGALVDSGKFNWSKDGKFPALTEPDPGYHGLKFHETFGELAFTFYAHAVGLRDLGPNQQPMNAFLTLAGIETLHLRMQRHVESAQRVAEFLEGHPKVSWVRYAGLPHSEYHDLAKKYLPNGAGAVFTFGLKDGFEAGKKLVEKVTLFSHLANIGDTRSLIIHPASTTHSQLSPEQLESAGAAPDVVRVSIGIEHVDDIIADLKQALES